MTNYPYFRPPITITPPFQQPVYQDQLQHQIPINVPVYTPQLNTVQNNTPPHDIKLLTKYIFESPWMITTRLKWTYSEYQYETYGITTADDYETSLQAMDTWTNTTRTIAELAEMYDDGKEFILRRPHDIETIFGIIQDYTEYVAWKFNNSIHLASFNLSENEDIKEVINDVVKLQNFANRIFPLAAQHAKDSKTEVKGLLGWVAERNGKFGLQSLNIDVLNKFGFTQETFEAKENRDQMTGEFNAVDVRREFNPELLKRLGGYI